MSETTAPERHAPTVEFVPFPDEVSPPGPLGGVPLEADPPPPAPWLVPAVILLVLGIAVVAVIAVLANGSTDRADRDVAPSPIPIELGPPLGDGRDVSTTAAPTTAEAPTTVLTTAAPTTAAPTTVTPTTVTPTTVAPTAVAPTTVAPAGGWIAFRSADPAFSVELPSQPEESREAVTVDGVVTTRLERIVRIGGGTLGIGSVRRAPGSDLDRFLVGVAEGAANQLKGRLELGAAGDSGGGRKLDFSVVLESGSRFYATAVSADGVLHVLSASGEDAAIRPAFFRVRASFQPG